MNKDKKREGMSSEEMSKNLQDMINGGDITRVVCDCGNAFFCGMLGEMNPGMIGCIPVGCPEPTVHTIEGGALCVNTYHCDCGEVIIGQAFYPLDGPGSDVVMNNELRVDEKVRMCDL